MPGSFENIPHRSTLNNITSIHDVDGTIVGDMSCQLIKAVIAGETSAGGGAFVNVKVNPSGALTVEADIQADAFTEDQLFDYKLANWDDAADPIYVGYLDKGGNYYIERYTEATGVLEYSAGTSGYAAAWTNRAAESYNSFDTEF